MHHCPHSRWPTTYRIWYLGWWTAMLSIFSHPVTSLGTWASQAIRFTGIPLACTRSTLIPVLPLSIRVVPVNTFHGDTLCLSQSKICPHFFLILYSDTLILISHAWTRTCSLTFVPLVTIEDHKPWLTHCF